MVTRANNVDYLVAKHLKRKRVFLGISQKELAEVAEVSIQQYQKYEMATNRITCGKIYLFAKHLKVPIEYFFGTSDGSDYEISEESMELRRFSKLARAIQKIDTPEDKTIVGDVLQTLRNIIIA
jgi:transcriptional regulator with XRE-family HTH domain